MNDLLVQLVEQELADADSARLEAKLAQILADRVADLLRSDPQVGHASLEARQRSVSDRRGFERAHGTLC